MKTFISIIVGAVIVTIFVFVGIIALNKQAKVDCLTWQKQAKTLTGFYLTKGQSEQCKSVGIIVNAPVK